MRPRVARAALMVLLASCLVGPTPGATGGCNDSDLDRPADVIQYCAEREELGCERQRLRGELDREEAAACRYAVRDMCAKRFWPADCIPTERVARACLRALYAKETLDTPEDEIEECKPSAFCSIKTEPDAGSGP